MREVSRLDRVKHIVNSIQAKTYLVLLDMSISFLMPILALIVRLEGDFRLYEQYVNSLYEVLPMNVAVTLVVFYFFGLYSRLWAYANIQDMLAIIGAVGVATSLIAIIGMYNQVSIPRSVFLLSGIFKLGSVITSRLVIKLAHYSRGKKEISEEQRRILIIGAGDAGVMIAREITQRGAGYTLVGFVDDDKKKIGSRLFGTSVMGNTDVVEDLVSDKDITDIIIAIPSADGTTIRRISNICKGCGCRVKILPSIYELIEDHAAMPQLRDIDINDLLRRQVVELNIKEVKSCIAGKTVLITGAGGSIGSELARQISRLQPKVLYLLGRGENSIYEIYQELLGKKVDVQCIPIIADVANEAHIKTIFAKYKPQVVFHAAAHKHVPLMEAQPEEAVRVNVFGTKNVVDASVDNEAEVFVMISTDKAVNPTNVMGASKRTAELIVQHASGRGQTKFLAVRFGNVLGSRGSVVPLFRKQIAAGGPITITHPDIIRYFMTIPEAVQLVLQAGVLAKGGEVFLLDMGEPVRVLDMAKDLVELHGLVPDKDIKFVFTGLRPGEKLYEELLTAEEGAEPTANKKIFKAKLREVNAEKLTAYLSELETKQERVEIIQTIMKYVTSYKSTTLRRAGDR